MNLFVEFIFTDESWNKFETLFSKLEQKTKTVDILQYNQKNLVWHCDCQIKIKTNFGLDSILKLAEKHGIKTSTFDPKQIKPFELDM